MIKRLMAASVLTVFGSAAQAGMIVYDDFSDLSGLQLNGTAAKLNPNGGDVLRLTDDLSQASSVFLKNRMSLSNQASFSAAFDFQISDPQGIRDSDGQGADGIVFVVQTQSNTAGGSGGSIGYGGLTNSVGIEFDTWNNGSRGSYNDADGNHVGININGEVSSIEQRNVVTRMNNGGIWNAWVDYDGITDLLEVRIADDGIRSSEAFLSLDIDLATVLGSPDAYIGFTSGTGAAGGDHDILNLQFRDDFNPITTAQVPVPGSLPLLGMGLLSLGAIARKTRQGSNA